MQVKFLSDKELIAEKEWDGGFSSLNAMTLKDTRGEKPVIYMVGSSLYNQESDTAEVQIWPLCPRKE